MNWKQDRVVSVFVGLVLAMHAVLGVDTARRMTVTHDEYWHLPVGLLNLRTGRFDYNDLNPPLVRMWTALPLLLTDVVPPGEGKAGASDAFGDGFLRNNIDRYQRLLTIGRSMNVLLSLATGVLLSIWAYQLFGRVACCLAALLWAVEPNVLAAASLVTMDSGTALFFLISLYVLWKYARQPSWPRAVWFGVVMGLAQLVKFTSLLLVPLCLVSWFVIRWHNNKAEGPRRSTLLWQWGVAALVGLAVLNAGYLFRGSFDEWGSYRFKSNSLRRLDERFAFLESWPVPLPRDYLLGVDHQRAVMESQHPVFLDGQWTFDGFADYYAKAMWYKLPHPLQLACVLAVLFLIWPGGERRELRTQALLCIPVALMFVIGSSTSMQLGLRYILPVMPFLVMFAAQIGRWLAWGRYPLRAVAVCLLAVLSPIAVRYHPNHLAYFNEWAGGPSRGYEHLIDSNIDWGQSLRDLKNYLDQQGVQKVGLAYFGTAPPAELGIDYDLPPVGMPEPGWYAISVNYLQGRSHAMRTPDNRHYSPDFGAYQYFRSFEPDARIGYSIYVYHIDQNDVARWFAAWQDQGQR